jgi:hypothetical protein
MFNTRALLWNSIRQDILKGQQAIIDFQQPLFDTWLKGTRLVGEV